MMLAKAGTQGLLKEHSLNTLSASFFQIGEAEKG
jgi:hypothetical protein